MFRGRWHGRFFEFLYWFCFLFCRFWCVCLISLWTSQKSINCVQSLYVLSKTSLRILIFQGNCRVHLFRLLFLSFLSVFSVSKRSQFRTFTVNLRHRLHGSSQIFEGTKTCTEIRLSFTRNQASFETANSSAIWNRICTVPCKRVRGCTGKKFVPFNWNLSERGVNWMSQSKCVWSLCIDNWSSANAKRQIQLIFFFCFSSVSFRTF